MGKTQVVGSDSSKDLVVLKKAELLRPIASPKDLIERSKEITAIIKETLEDGTDYGIIPGAGSKKVLLKPGAERLCVAFGCHPEYEIKESLHEPDRKNSYKDRRTNRIEESIGFSRFVVSCELVKDDRTVGSGIGSCSTMENKYISRPRDVENTVLKMAQKRALVAAVLNTFALSDRFTQDVEEEIPVPHKEDSPQKVTKLYTGSAEQQQAVAEILRKKNIPEDIWDQVHQRLMGRPGADLPKILNEMEIA